MSTTTRQFLQDNARWLCAGVLLTFCSSYGQTFFIGAFAGGIKSDFGLSHAAWGAIYGAGTVLSGITMIWAGALTDRFRVRTIGVFTLLCLGIACLTLASVSAVWMLVPAVWMLRLFGQGMSSHTAMTAMARWFVATRGRALATATLGFAMGEALLPISFVALSAHLHWRSLWVLAALMALAPIPILWRLLRTERTPQSASEDSHAPGMKGLHWTRAQTLRHPLFAAMIPMMLGPAACFTAMIFNQSHLAATKGWEHLQFVALFPLFTLCSIASLIVSGWAIDRFGTGRIMPVMQLPMAMGFWLMGQAETLPHGALAMAFLAFTVGANSTVPVAFWAEYFGTRHIGAIRALATSIMVLGSAIGPSLTGIFLDQGVTLDTQLAGMGAFIVCASILIAVVVRRSQPDLPSRAEIYGS